jgi:hypothetical protein
MARTNVALMFNVLGQTLNHRVMQGRPTAATFQVFRNYAVDEGTAEFSGNATIDSVNTAVNASSGAAQADPQKISLASVAGIITGRKYLLSENSLQEWVEPMEIGATYIRVRFPLTNNYTTAALFQSTTISAAVDATFIQTLGKVSDLTDMAPDYRVRWAVTIAAVSYVFYSFFDVTRIEQQHHVDIDDLNARAPGLYDSLPVEYRPQDGRPLIDSAWRAVRAQFAAIGLDIGALRDNEVLDELVILRSLQMLGEGGWSPPNTSWQAWAAIQAGNYERFFEAHFAVTVKHQTEIQQQLRLAATFADIERNVRPPPFWRK